MIYLMEKPPTDNICMHVYLAETALRRAKPSLPKAIHLGHLPRMTHLRQLLLLLLCRQRPESKREPKDLPVHCISSPSRCCPRNFFGGFVHLPFATVPPIATSRLTPMTGDRVRRQVARQQLRCVATSDVNIPSSWHAERIQTLPKPTRVWSKQYDRPCIRQLRV